MAPTSHIDVISSESFDEVLEEAGSANVVLVLLGYIAMFAFVVASSARPRRADSHALLGLYGLLLVAGANVAALGLFSYVGLDFNATILQVLPFLALGLGVDDMFLLIQVLRDIPEKRRESTPDVCAYVLEHGGSSITLTSACNACGFFMGALIPLPAVTNFCLAAGLVVVCNWFTLVFGFTAVLGMETRRKGRDLFDCICAGRSESTFSVQKWVDEKYAHALSHAVTKIAVLLVAAALLGASIYGILNVENGLDITDAVPKDDPLYSFSQNRFDYFNLFDGYAVIEGGVDYATIDVQEKMANFRADLMKSKWLTQRGAVVTSFMVDLATSMSENGINGECNSNDQTWCARCTHDKLLNYTWGLAVPPSIFYPCLVLWRANYTTTYVSSAYFADSDILSFVPKGKSFKSGVYDVWPAVPTEATFDGYHPGDIGFGALPFRVEGVKVTEDYISMIEDIRSIIKKHNDLGLNIYPSGDVFVYWEQYIGLDQRFWETLAYCILAVFVATMPLLVNAAVSLIVTTCSAIIVVEAYGFLYYADMKFSAIPAVSLIMALGIAVEFTAHMAAAFVLIPSSTKSSSTILARRDAQMRKAVSAVCVPVLQGGISSFIGFLFLAFTDFEFIRKYFFGMYSMIVLLGLFNGLAVLPVVLSLVGPITSGSGAAAYSPRHGEHERVHSTDVGKKAVEMGFRKDPAVSVSGTRPIKELAKPKSNSIDIANT